MSKKQTKPTSKCGKTCKCSCHTEKPKPKAPRRNKKHEFEAFKLGVESVNQVSWADLSHSVKMNYIRTFLQYVQ